MHRFLSSLLFLRLVFYVGLVTVFSGFVFIAVQQEIRHTANDPQIQIAEDAQNALTQGFSMESVIPSGSKVDLAISLSSFIVLFDEEGNPIGGNALLNGKLPRLPQGVFGYVRENGEDRVTWQPQPELRFAAVITRYAGAKSSGFILVARSLREVEERQIQLLMQAAIAWVLSCLLILFFVPWISQKEARKK